MKNKSSSFVSNKHIGVNFFNSLIIKHSQMLIFSTDIRNGKAHLYLLPLL